MDSLTTGALIALLSACVGGSVTHLLTRQREVLKFKQELRIRFLSDAYVMIANCSYRPDYSVSTAELKKALTLVHLWGSEEQTIEANRIAEGFGQNESEGRKIGDLVLVKTEPLCKLLRSDLRLDLELGNFYEIPKIIKLAPDNH